MDISKITDRKELESMAYQQIKTINVAQANLQAIETRLSQMDTQKEK